MSESTTAKVARQVIRESAGSRGPHVAVNPSTVNLATHFPRAAVAEVGALTGHDTGNKTKRIAATEVALADPRRWSYTDDGLLRREHPSDSTPAGSAERLSTEGIARDEVDKAAGREYRNGGNQ